MGSQYFSFDFVESGRNMAKSIRSKIKRYWRSRLRATVGAEHQAKQEKKVFDELNKTVNKQTGSSILSLKSKIGKQNNEPEASPEADKSQDAMVDVSEKPKKKAAKEMPKAVKKTKKKGRGKKFVHFHTKLKKGT